MKIFITTLLSAAILTGCNPVLESPVNKNSCAVKFKAVKNNNGDYEIFFDGEKTFTLVIDIEATMYFSKCKM